MLNHIMFLHDHEETLVEDMAQKMYLLPGNWQAGKFPQLWGPTDCLEHGTVSTVQSNNYGQDLC